MFFTYIWRELRRRRRQALAVSLGLALGIGLVITVTAVSSGVKAAQGTVLHSLYGVGTDISVTQSATQGSGGARRFNFNPGNRSQEGKSFSRDNLTPTRGQGTLASSAVTTVTKLPHVSNASGGLSLTDLQFSGTFAKGQTGSGGFGGFGRGGSQGGSQSGSVPSAPPVSINTFTVDGVDVAAARLGPLSSTQLSSGRAFTSADAKAKVALVDSSYAKQNALKAGSSVTIASTKFDVVGVVTAPTGDSSANVYVPLAEAQSLASLSDKVTTLYITADSSSNISAVQSEIQKAMPDATVTTSADLAGEVNGSLSSASSLANNLGKWLSIAVLIAAFLLASLFTMSAVARRVREFGTLKALGWRSRRIVGQVMGEALVQGVIGGAIGVGLGFAGAAIVDKTAPTLTASLNASNAGGYGGGGFRGGFGGGAGGAGGGAARRPGGFGEAAQHAANTVAVHLSASVTVTAIVLAVVLAVAGGVIAGVLGGWRAARLGPATALRSVD